MPQVEILLLLSLKWKCSCLTKSHLDVMNAESSSSFIFGFRDRSCSMPGQRWSRLLFTVLWLICCCSLRLVELYMRRLMRSLYGWHIRVLREEYVVKGELAIQSQIIIYYVFNRHKCIIARSSLSHIHLERHACVCCYHYCYLTL